MLIMSQNNKGAYNTDNILAVSVDVYSDAFGLWVANRSDYRLLGRYATEDRAKEVLDMIYNLWHMGAAYFEMPEE